MVKVANPPRSSSVAPSASSKYPTWLHHTTTLHNPTNAHRQRANKASYCVTQCLALFLDDLRVCPAVSMNLPDLADMVFELSVSMKQSKDITLIVSSKHDAGLIVFDKRITAADKEYGVEAWFPTARLMDLSDKLVHYEVSSSLISPTCETNITNLVGWFEPTVILGLTTKECECNAKGPTDNYQFQLYQDAARYFGQFSRCSLTIMYLNRFNHMLTRPNNHVKQLQVGHRNQIACMVLWVSLISY